MGDLIDWKQIGMDAIRTKDFDSFILFKFENKHAVNNNMWLCMLETEMCDCVFVNVCVLQLLYLYLYMWYNKALICIKTDSLSCFFLATTYY